MKEKKYWMLVTSNKNPLLFNGQLPIYWMKKIAEREGKKHKAIVVEVTLTWQ